MKATLLLIVFFILVFGVLSCSNESQITIEGVSISESLKINEIQVLGTHNSYSKAIDTNLLNYVSPLLSDIMGKYVSNMSDEDRAKFKEFHPNDVPMTEGLAYDHPDFITQLAAGIRSFELDVFYDTVGSYFSQPAGYTLMREKGITDLLAHDTTDLDKPGLKVLHMADIDFRTQYTTLERALKVLKKWSSAHPNHVPIFIMIEAKDSGIPLLPNATQVIPFSSDAYTELDKTVIDILGRDHIITPDDVRADYETLEDAILAKHWPKLQSSLGKFVLMLLPGTAGMAKENKYVVDHPSLEGRAMFVQSKIGDPHAAFLLFDNAIIRQKEIQTAIKKGYLVRTRADIETYEAKVNDMTRANAAFESGAQIVSTDFFRPGNAYQTDYVVKMPNEAIFRVNPLIE